MLLPKGQFTSQKWSVQDSVEREAMPDGGRKSSPDTGCVRSSPVNPSSLLSSHSCSVREARYHLRSRSFSLTLTMAVAH